MIKRIKINVVACSVGLSIIAGFTISCGTTVRPAVKTGYDWTQVNRICVVGVSDLNGSAEVSRALTHHLFENGYPVVHRDTNSILNIFDVGRQEKADIIGYGVVTKVETYYSNYSNFGYNYPSKELELELNFVETQTRREIWKGSVALVDSASVDDSFIIHKAVEDALKQIAPEWEQLPRISVPSPMLKIGDRAPLFELSDVNGNLYSLRDDIGEKIVVLNFWSFFCEQCKQRMPIMDAANRRYSGKGVKIISVSLEGEPLADRIKSYLDDSGYDLMFLLDDYSKGVSKVADLYKVPGTPSLYVIGKSGEIVFARSGHITARDLSAVIETEIEKK